MSAGQNRPPSGAPRDEGPRLEIRFGPGALGAIAKAAIADPVPSGRAGKIAKAAVTGDTFFHRMCRRCGTRRSHICWQGGTVPLCPPCTVERIERLAGAGTALHPTVLWLYFDAKTVIRQAAKAERAALSVRFNDLYRCWRCRGVIREKDVQYWRPPATGELYPHCAPCREIRVSGSEPYDPPDEPPLDLGVDPAEWRRDAEDGA